MDCIVEYRISRRVNEQFEAFMAGFSELIPQDLINVFDERELELLIGGMSEIDVYVTYHPLSISFMPNTNIGQRRLEQVHGLPRIRNDRRGHPVVLAVRPQLASGT